MAPRPSGRNFSAIARQVEGNGADTAESWVAEHHDEEETRKLLIVAVILWMETKLERGEAPPGYGDGARPMQ